MAHLMPFTFFALPFSWDLILSPRQEALLTSVPFLLSAVGLCFL